MTTKPKAKKFRIRRDAPLGQSPQEKPQAAALPPPPAARSGQVESAKSASAETALDAIRREGLTGRQLRMARRVAQKILPRPLPQAGGEQINYSPSTTLAMMLR